jgi:hypothetical protein
MSKVSIPKPMPSLFPLGIHPKLNKTGNTKWQAKTTINE